MTRTMGACSVSQTSRARILAVTDRIGPQPTNGAQVFAEAILRQLTQGFEIEVLVAETQNGPCEPFPVFGVPGDADALPAAALTPHLIYNLGATSWSCRVASLAARRWPKAALVNHFQLNLAAYARFEQMSPERIRAFGRIQGEVAVAAAANIYPSMAELELGWEDWPAPGAHSHLAPNPFVPATVELPTASAKGGAFTFLATGRFSDRSKGADMLYRAFASLRAAGAEAELAVISDTPRFIELLAGLPTGAWSRQDWLDRASLHKAMRAADVVVVPSRYEPFGLVAIEAIAMGTPVIAMAVGGLRETVHHGVSGWLCEPREGSYGLALAMGEAMARGRPALRAMGEAAAAVVRRDYSVDRVGEQLRRVLDNLLGERSVAAWEDAPPSVAARGGLP